MPDVPAELHKIYCTRFSGNEVYREQVWLILIREFLSQWIAPEATVLDLGCGYGEFINNIRAGTRLAMDLNPSARSRLVPDVQLLEQDCSSPWPLPENSLDLVFTSNFFEHLPTKQSLKTTLIEAVRCLKPGGRLIAIGPNVKYLSGEYWDFFDHYLPLTERSLAEVMTMVGYSIERSTPRFLPYTMSQGFQPPLWTVRAFLKLPYLWRLFGRQFLVIARKPGVIA